MPKIYLLALLGLLAACASGPVATTETSSHGLVAIEVDPPSGRQANVPVELWSLAYSPAEGKTVAGPIKGHIIFNNMGGTAQKARRYYLAGAEPGIYVLTAITASQWGVCFNGGAPMFEVTPGEITFLGRLDPTPSLEEVRTAHLPTLAHRGQYFHVFDTPRAALTPPEQLPGWEASLQAHLAANAPPITAPARAAHVRLVTFKTGKNLLGDRVC